MDWKFDSGIVAIRNKTYNTFLQRIYYVRYRSSGNICRLVTAAFAYSKLDSEDRTKFIQSLMAKDEKVYLESLDSTGKIIPSMSKVVTIMDFDITEKGPDQQPKDPRSFEKNFLPLNNDSNDINNFLTLAHFEENIKKAAVDKCICTLTNDEESKRRIDEILATSVKESITEEQRKEERSKELESGPMANLKRILELEMFIMKQNQELETLKERVKELEYPTTNPEEEVV